MKILFTGDICYKNFEKYVGSEQILHIYNEVKPVFDRVDFRMVNLECVLTDKASVGISKTGPCIKAESQFVEHLKYLKVDLAGLANNHIGDFGEKGIFDTMSILDKNGIAHIGAGANIKEAYDSYTLKKDGISVSVIASCENEFGIAGNNMAGGAGFNLSILKHRIEEEKKNADFVVVFFHGGNEFNPFPSPVKTELYRLLIDFGADSVVAMHTHCPQGYEYYNGKPIIYSMGNFFFPTKVEDTLNLKGTWYYGYMTELDFLKDEIKIEIHPYSFGSVEDKMKLLSMDEKTKFMDYLSELSKPIENSEKIEELFNVWSTIDGEKYEWCMNFSSNMKSDVSSELCFFRNLFSCEAHNEMTKRFATLCYNNEFYKYKEMQSEIKKYQDLEKFLCKRN